MPPPQTPGAIEGAITILLVDDHLVVRQGLRMLLENHADLVVVGEAACGREALDIAARERPNVVLLDLDLGGESALDIISRLASIAPDVRVLILTGVRDSGIHRRAIRLGAAGVVLKEQAGDHLVKALRLVHAGEMWVDRSMTAAILQEMRQGTDGQPADPEASRIESLTSREREIVVLVAQGHGTKKIADLLFISEKTVRNHLAATYSKLAVSGRLELALYSLKHGLATTSSPKRSSHSATRP